jgi:hypothetical protein
MFDYSASFKPRAKGSVDKAAKALALALPQHYIYDIIRNHWRGALYTYAYQSVWDGAGKPSRTYLTPVEGESFKSVLSTSFAEHMADLTHKRRNITASDRVFLKFLYSKKVTAGDQAAHKFDVEHWIPVKRIQDMTANADPWALGALGNLGVLPAGPNRIKKDETVSEYLKRSGKGAPDAQTSALVASLTFLPPAEVAISKKGGKDAMTKVQYDDFVTRNWQAMTDQLVTNLGIQEQKHGTAPARGRAKTSGKPKRSAKTRGK